MGPLCTLAIKQKIKYVQKEWLIIIQNYLLLLIYPCLAIYAEEYYKLKYAIVMVIP